MPAFGSLNTSRPPSGVNPLGNASCPGSYSVSASRLPSAARQAIWSRRFCEPRRGTVGDPAAVGSPDRVGHRLAARQPRHHAALELGHPELGGAARPTDQRHAAAVGRQNGLVVLRGPQRHRRRGAVARDPVQLGPAPGGRRAPRARRPSSRARTAPHRWRRRSRPAGRRLRASPTLRATARRTAGRRACRRARR